MRHYCYGAMILMAFMVIFPARRGKGPQRRLLRKKPRTVQSRGLQLALFGLFCPGYWGCWGKSPGSAYLRLR